MVAFRTLVSSFLLPIALLSPSIQGSGLFERDLASPLLKERAIVNGNICAEVDLALGNLPLGLDPIVLAQDVCICARAGVLTPASLTTLGTVVTSNQNGLLAPVLSLVGGVAGATTRLVSQTLPLLLQEDTDCVYPANATPNSCGSCGYVCDTGFTDSGGACCAAGFTGCNGVCVVTGSVCCPAGQVNCNGQCVPSGQLCCPAGQFACGSVCVADGTVCQSGIPVTPVKRGLNSATCPLGFEACKIPSSPRSKNFGAAFECINTASDLESCGGCVVPILGRPQGQDCSAIANVDSAICQAGRCVIESCARGFTNNGSACVKTESSGRKLSGYWAALEQASHVILQE